MWQSITIQFDGSIVGAAVPQEKGVRFIAIDGRVVELDQTVWPSAADVRRAVEKMLRIDRPSSPEM